MQNTAPALRDTWNTLQNSINNGINAFTDHKDQFLSQDKKFITLSLFLSIPIVYCTFRILRKIVTKLIPTKIYVRDFQVFQADPAWKLSSSQMLKSSQNMNFNANSLNFMRKLSKHNGIGPDVAIPPTIFVDEHNIENTRVESRAVWIPTVKELLEKTGILSSQIDVLVTNSSLFVPLPSLSSMIVNEFKMKKDIHSFSLGGMGCSSNPIGVDVIQSFLQNRNLKYALLVSTESFTLNYYIGNDVSMLLPNTLFRTGCAAILFTNVNYKCKYVLKHLIRTHIGADDSAHKCIYQDNDSDGILGLRLEKSIISNASKAMLNNTTRLFAKVLPLHLKLSYVWRIISAYSKWYLKTRLFKVSTTYPRYEIPHINRAVDNFCFHTGGRGVLDAMQKQFNLSDGQIAASRASLFKYGNTSSPSIWYSLAYHEQTNSVLKNNIIWQVAFGSGFKCNSIIWKALRTIRDNKTLFDRQKPNCAFESDLNQILVDENEMKTDYEQIVRERQKKEEENEWKETKRKFMNRFIEESGSRVKQVLNVD
ncbi:3-ketoacyl-CoA_synthase [Hexamita inflata]|uniref:3-ketoacyl-CoA synthase n=1 Tax=Hexamita inflata TaxID=28002 RepID=A0AA86P8V8_9EUKA|nr:3-ketoacyl-CoA synthase [Hexamita inflata]